MITLPIDDAAQHLSHLREQLTHGDSTETATLTEEGKPVLAVMTWDRYETLLEMVQDADILLSAPPEIRHHALTVAVAKAELLYTDPQLLDFEAFGNDDLFDGLTQ